MTADEAKFFLKLLRRRLVLLRQATRGAVVEVPEAAIPMGVVLGEVEEMTVMVQAALNFIETGTAIPVMTEDGPTEADTIN